MSNRNCRRNRSDRFNDSDIFDTSERFNTSRRNNTDPFNTSSRRRNSDRLNTSSRRNSDVENISENISRQRHVHEAEGSVFIAEEFEDAHNHRFATVTGEAIPFGRNDHYHEIRFRTDFFDDHFHEFSGRTSGAIDVGDRHVHFLESRTTRNEDHRHEFRLATMIDDPIGED